MTHLHRLAVLALGCFAFVLVPSRDAHADTTDAVDMCTANTIPIAAAFIAPARHHTATSARDELRWDARYIVDVDAAFDFKGGALRFAAPLATDELVAWSDSNGVAPILDENRQIVGVCVKREALHDRTIRVSFVEHQDVAALSDRQAPIHPPIAATNAVQIVQGMFDVAHNSSGDGARIEITGGNLERHVGYVAPHAIGHAAREEARRLTDTNARVSESLIYLRGEDVRGGGAREHAALEARIVDARAHAHRSAFGVGLLFASIVGALVFAARRLRRSASEERADAVLASEIEKVAEAER